MGQASKFPASPMSISSRVPMRVLVDSVECVNGKDVCLSIKSIVAGGEQARYERMERNSHGQDNVT